MTNEVKLGKLLIRLLVVPATIAFATQLAHAGLAPQCVDLLSSSKKPLPQFSFRMDSQTPAIQELTLWFKAQDTLRFFPSADYLIPGHEGMNRQHGNFFTLTHVLKKLSSDLSQSQISLKKEQDQQKYQLELSKKRLVTIEREMLDLPRQKVQLEEALKKEEDYLRQAPKVLGEVRIKHIQEQVERLREDLDKVRNQIAGLPFEKARLESSIRADESSVANNTLGERQKKFESRTREFVLASAELLSSSVSNHFRSEEAMLTQKVQRSGNGDSEFHQNYLAKHFEEHHAFEQEMAGVVDGIRQLGTNPQEIKEAAKALAIKIDTWLILHIKVNDTLTYDKMSR